MKEDIKNIFSLRKQKKYEDIYENYGRNIYLIFSSRNYKTKEINTLLNNRKYFELYEKYGEKIYNRYLSEMRQHDIENELEVHFGFNNYVFFENLKSKLKVVYQYMVSTIISFSALTCSIGIKLSNFYDEKIESNGILYEEEINDYNHEIQNYASYINSLNLSDLEIIIKVMNDMWNTIDGYKFPDSYDGVGYQRLSIYMNGYGVCRNMADDFTTRMNAINPNYEACNLNVYFKDVEMNDIREDLFIRNSFISDNSIYQSSAEADDFLNSGITNIVGNHMVSCVKSNEDDVLFIVDPTNPSIGILKNGQIYMLSNQVMYGIEIKPIGNIILGSSNREDYLKKFVESFFTNGDFDSLKDKYGITSQNETLVKINQNYTTDHYKIRKR